MKKSSKPWQIWQGLFIGMIIGAITSAPREPVSPIASQFGTLFRIFLGAAGLCGFLVIYYLRKRDEAQQWRIAPTSGEVGEKPLAVTYRSTLEEGMPVLLQLQMRLPVNWVGMAMFGYFAVSLGGKGIDRAYQASAWLGYPLLFALGAAAFFGFNVLVMTAEMWTKCHNRTRICATELMPDGVSDQMPEKTVILKWNQIRSIELIAGSISFLTLVGGLHIPASAFRSEDSRQQFMNRAITLWKSKGAAWQSVVSEAQPDPMLF